MRCHCLTIGANVSYIHYRSTSTWQNVNRSRTIRLAALTRTHSRLQLSQQATSRYQSFSTQNQNFPLWVPGGYSRKVYSIKFIYDRFIYFRHWDGVRANTNTLSRSSIHLPREFSRSKVIRWVFLDYPTFLSEYSSESVTENNFENILRISRLCHSQQTYKRCLKFSSHLNCTALCLGSWIGMRAAESLDCWIFEQSSLERGSRIESLWY